jgi:hypothetical protein
MELSKREFEEETGVTPVGLFMALKAVKQKGGRDSTRNCGNNRSL